MTNQQWARSNEEKATAFADHLEKVFQPIQRIIPAAEEEEIHTFLDVPTQMDLPIRKIKVGELVAEIKTNLDSNKAPGYDLITGKILRELPLIGNKLITYIFNAVLYTNNFPVQWKIAEIIMIPKPGKAAEEITSYRPISLLPCLSKLFEKLLLKRLQPILINKKVIPPHQFGFRKQHSTIEQVHRIVNYIRTSLEEKRYCSAVFLDISQAFDRVWHEGLLYKLKQTLPQNFYFLLRSYLTDRGFLVKYDDARTTLVTIKSGVPQGSVLEPLL